MKQARGINVRETRSTDVNCEQAWLRTKASDQHQVCKRWRTGAPIQDEYDDRPLRLRPEHGTGNRIGGKADMARLGPARIQTLIRSGHEEAFRSRERGFRDKTNLGTGAGWRE